MTLSTILVTSRRIFRRIFIGNTTNWYCYLASSRSLFTAVRLIYVNWLPIRTRINLILTSSCIYSWASFYSIVLIKLYFHIWSINISGKSCLKLLLDSTHSVFIFFGCLFKIWVNLCYLSSDGIFEYIVKIKLIRQFDSEVDPSFSVSFMNVQ
jgi:hypothetical protein